MKLVPAISAALALATAAPPAFAATASSHTALALGAIVGSYSPLLSIPNKVVLALLFEDKPVGSSHQTPITVTATSVVCRAGDVDIAAFSCALTFGTKQVTLTGRHAHELFVTVGEAGVPPDVAAGTAFEALHT